MFKVAFLFLVISGINHADCWRKFFEGNEELFSLYVHAKELCVDDGFFKQHELAVKAPNARGKTMPAQMALLREAIKDPENSKFIFLSESTIPLQNFTMVYDTLMRAPGSMFYYYPNPHALPKDSLYTERNLVPLSADKQFKNTQWVVLSREHVELMLQDTYYLPIAMRSGCDNELYAGTFLTNIGRTHEITRRDTTYVQWRVPRGERAPYNFTDLSNNRQRAMLVKARNDGFLFARKLDIKCDLSPLIG